MSLGGRFHKLFSGLDRAHGFYSYGGALSADSSTPGKLVGKRHTVSTGATEELWNQHLAGTYSIGIVPIRDGNDAVFGAIDVDEYDLDLKALDAMTRRLELPTITCRTKSGGAHLYVFLSAPAPAELVRDRLAEWSIALGRAGVEIFPKQIKLASEDDTGNWINMPYQGGSKSTRYALGPGGKAIGPEAFLALAAERAISPEDLAAFELPEDPLDEALLGAPPCLQTLARKGFGDWQNNGMFNVAVYLKKRFGDAMNGHLDAYNNSLMNPPLGHADLATVGKSVGGKKYSYMCKQSPIKECCDRRVCLTRDFGIGGLPDDPGVVMGEIVKLSTVPPTYIWDVNGARLELTSDELMDQRKFNKKVVEELDKWPSIIKTSKWVELVRSRLSSMTKVEVPEDATREGQLWVQLSGFCTSRVTGKNLDELLQNRAVVDDATKRTYFRSTDFLAYLLQHRVTGVSERDLYRWLRRRSVEHHQKMIKGKFTNYWSVPSFERQTEEFDVPRVPLGDVM